MPGYDWLAAERTGTRTYGFGSLPAMCLAFMGGFGLYWPRSKAVAANALCRVGLMLGRSEGRPSLNFHAAVQFCVLVAMPERD